ncbi:MAG TPA: SDR family oxidoreductase [Acidimicrobiales bacterium]|nr:SDR family oxidoreductase [Acidimicrobiales bacterium]
MTRKEIADVAGMCDGRVCIVTGSGRGIGREHALALAREGARVVVNDVGRNLDGSPAGQTPADDVVGEIRAAGGTATANHDDVATWQGAETLVAAAVETYGGLDVLINNAGIVRDRMLVNMSEEEWDSVVDVHLKGTFLPTRLAAAYWRERSKAGEPVDARVINTTSVSGIYGNPGQSNYGAAKMGIAGFTIIVAQELARYGVTVNALAPVALTRMTEGLRELTEEERAVRAPSWVSPVAVWLASVQSGDITGRVFEVSGQVLAIAEGWHRGPRTTPVADPWNVDQVARELLGRARPNADGMGDDPPGWSGP